MYCSFLDGYDTIKCCSSCHEDDEMFNIGGLDLELEHGLYEVCCKAKEWATKQEHVLVKDD